MDDLAAMALALAEARAAAEAGDVPVGAVVLHGGEIVGRGRNRREALRDPTWHAEVEAIRAASSRLGRWRLTGCTLLVTLEPCPMCAYALVLARVDRVAWAATDPRFGGAGSLHALLRDPRHNHRPAVTTGLLAEECSDLLKDFFRARRA